MADHQETLSVFHRYPDLPLELKLKIVEQAAPRPYTSVLRDCNLACIDRAWQETMEKRTFVSLRLSASDLPDFERICVGRRRRILKTISLHMDLRYCCLNDDGDNECTADQVVNPAAEQDDNIVTASGGRSSPSEVVLSAFARLFWILRTWQVNSDRPGPDRLLNLEYFFTCSSDLERRPIECSFEALPMIEVVGKASHCLQGFGSFLVPASTLSLLSRMRNLITCEVDLRVDRVVQSSIDSANSLLLSLQPIQARSWKMKELQLDNGVWLGLESREASEACNASFRTLTTSIFHLTHRLEKLVLYHVVDVGHFFRASWDTSNPTAQQSPTWPCLRDLEIRGSFAHETSGPEATDEVLLAVTRSLSHMPSIESLKVAFFEQPLFEEDNLASGYFLDWSPDFLIEFLTKLDEGGVWHSAEPTPKDASVLIISRFLLTSELMQPWENLAKDRGASELQIFRGKWYPEEGFVGYCWDGDSIGSQEAWDAGDLWYSSDPEMSDS